jgi:crotonobetainyl-CoA:carnitine CoA-transferase CaiB-like acyl-CoA transferase
MLAPLAGVRVVDFTHILAGPFCTQFLADAGATVVKVEPPGGEYARIRGPRRVGPDGTEVSSYNAAINRGKRSIALDLKNPSGLATALRLVETADVVVENFAPGALARLGLDLVALRVANPRLITASISLYGGLEFAGALATRGGLAIVAEGESSVTSMTRDRSGTPLALGLPLGDMATGMAGYAAITTALYEREHTGVGRHLDLSMVRTLLALNACGVTGAQIANANLFDLRTAGYGIYPASDGHVTIGVNNDSLFQRLTVAMDRPELAEDPRYADYRNRDLNADEVDAIIAAWTSTLTCDEVICRVAPTGVPCGKVATPGDVLADLELRGLGFFETVEDGLGGTIDTPANPLGFRRDGYVIPRLAQHDRELLAEIGIDADGYAKLAADGAFGNRPPTS